MFGLPYRYGPRKCRGGIIQGDWRLDRQKGCLDAFKDLFDSAGAVASSADMFFNRCVILLNVEGHVANRGRDFGGRVLAGAAGIYGKGDMQNVMLAVLERPVAADFLGEGVAFGSWRLM